MKLKQRLLVVPLVLAATTGMSLAPALPVNFHAAATHAAGVSAPKVPNANALQKKYGGTTITWVGDAAVGNSHVRDLLLAAEFSKDTGIAVNLIPHPSASDAAYQQLARNFSAKSSDIDVMMLDVVWPGAFAPYLADLKSALKSSIPAQSQSIIKNDTVDGRLVAMPWFGDYGILYYRTDLLKKYGYNAPPKTWEELGTMAAKIQAGEQKSNKNFYGFVFQGNSYEGLTCDALEWIASSGGGNFIDKGKVSINNPKAIAVLNLIGSWIGKITPRGVTSYQEEDARNVFDAGNAAFMRNWPYAYSISKDPKSSKVVNKFDVATLPSANGHVPVGTVGGWQLGVSKYSKHVAASQELVRYLTSPAVEKFNAIFNSNVPTIPSVASDPQVRATNPYLKPAIANVMRVTRPAGALGTRYNQGSQAIYQGINQILNGQDARNVVPSIASKLQRLVK
jgi:trehalose/maltose transport system substrate-binding protein